jgi:hypothetical protein
MRPTRTFLKRNVHIFAFANNRYAGYGLASIHFFLQLFEKYKIELDLHRSSAQRRLAEFRHAPLKNYFYQPVFSVVPQHDFVPRLNFRARLNEGIR